MTLEKRQHGYSSLRQVVFLACLLALQHVTLAKQPSRKTDEYSSDNWVTTDSGDVCISPTKTYTARMDPFASELGYYYFEECGDVLNPTIGIELFDTYTFVQQHRTNWRHPLGFSYVPDATHHGSDELDPGTTVTDSPCAEDYTCPAPMYFVGQHYLGHYSNSYDTNITRTYGSNNYGVDQYKSYFTRPITEWSGYNTFNIKLRFTDSIYTKDLFYYCRVHKFLNGRIKILRGGKPINNSNEPALGHGYKKPLGGFDEKCGTYGLDEYYPSHPGCPHKFICGLDDEDIDPDFVEYATCVEVAGCKMMTDMTIDTSSRDESATFIHGMIPHHQQAVNTAKSLLKLGSLKCDDLVNADKDPECLMLSIVYEIIAGQNHQIQLMQKVLDGLSLPQTDSCVAPSSDKPDDVYSSPSTTEYETTGSKVQMDSVYSGEGEDTSTGTDPIDYTAEVIDGYTAHQDEDGNVYYKPNLSKYYEPTAGDEYDDTADRMGSSSSSISSNGATPIQEANYRPVTVIAAAQTQQQPASGGSTLSLLYTTASMALATMSLVALANRW